ncbi:protein maelstrom homolog [Armigeres subalbatus]|uniref:protein maelstrom homolog n=1 Tax=Armigeres subalbatus TaxID=124917 RepID=UPI002ED02187
MSARKKPAAKGPFFFFMLEFRRREESRGKSFPGGMDQVMREAGPFWNQLTDIEREVYKDRAKSYKELPKQNYGEKYTAQGIAYSQVEMEKQQLLKKQATIRKTISEMIETASLNNALEKLEIFFISCNYFCKTYTEEYVPAEMALIKYNLELGVLDRLHLLINPVKLPLGLAHEARNYSEESHELPTPPNAMGETDFLILLQKILSFTDYNKKPYKLFPLMTDAKEVPVIESIIKQLNDEAKIEYQFLVIPLGEFFFQLKRATEKYGLDICTFPTKTVADILLKKDAYEYTSGIACDFHEKMGNQRFCALSKVIRWSYIISDNCCLDLSIDLIAGRHLPSNADTTLCSDLYETTSRTNLSQADGVSFVSSSELSNFTLPKIQKVRAKSPFRNMEDKNGSVIYSSRTVTKNLKKEPSDTNAAPINPFHMLDCNDSVYAPNYPGRSRGAGAGTSYNPFSRQKKLEAVREPHGLDVKGKGRGTLLVSANNSFSSMLKGAGRGAGLFSGLSSVGTKSSIRSSDDED